MIKLSMVLCIACVAIAGCKAKVTKVDDKALDKALDQAMAAADKADKADKPEPKPVGAAGGGGAGGAEAQLALHNLEKRAKMAFVEKAEFPKGKVGPTPSAACCPTTCAPSPAAWSDPVWKELDFTIDEPTHFQYSYDSDGKTFTATAVGDTDCDGQNATFTLTGKLDAAGNPTVDLQKPAAGQY